MAPVVACHLEAGCQLGVDGGIEATEEPGAAHPAPVTRNCPNFTDGNLECCRMSSTTLADMRVGMSRARVQSERRDTSPNSGWNVDY